MWLKPLTSRREFENESQRAEDTHINNVETVHIYVVNSKFDVLHEESNVAVTDWIETYYKLYNRYKEKTDYYSRYIIVSDENNVYYCTKLKIN